MKKIACFLASMTLFALPSTFASDNFRIGISLGGAYHSAKAKSLTTDSHNKLAKGVPSAGIILGYDHFIRETPLFIGLEVGFNNHNSEKIRLLNKGLYSGGVEAPELKIKTNNSFTASLRFGVRVKDTLIYAKFGASSTNWQTRISIAKSEYAESRKNYQKMGYVGGIGLESRMSPNFSIGIEHSYSFHNYIKNLHPKIALKIRPISQTTGIRLIYNL